MTNGAVFSMIWEPDIPAEAPEEVGIISDEPEPETKTGATDQDSESSAPVATESGKMTAFGISGGISGAFP